MIRLSSISPISAVVTIILSAASSVPPRPHGEALFPKTGHENPVEWVHARPGRHCHHSNTRVHCHKKDPLPLGWPPVAGSVNGRLNAMPI